MEDYDIHCGFYLSELNVKKARAQQVKSTHEWEFQRQLMHADYRYKCRPIEYE